MHSHVCECVCVYNFCSLYMHTISMFQVCRKSVFHKSFRQKGISGGLSPILGRVCQSRLSRIVFRPVLNISTAGESTICLGNPLQCLTTLTVKKCFLVIISCVLLIAHCLLSCQWPLWREKSLAQSSLQRQYSTTYQPARSELMGAICQTLSI